MKMITAAIAILLCAAGCTETATKELPADPTTTTTTTVQISARMCEKIGPADEDPIISNLIQLGHDLDYVSGDWFFNGEKVGEAPSEDSGFDFCSDPETLAAVSEERMYIIAAGGYGS